MISITRPTYNYLVDNIYYTSTDELIEALNIYGSENWELISINFEPPSSYNFTPKAKVVFKKESI